MRAREMRAELDARRVEPDALLEELERLAATRRDTALAIHELATALRPRLDTDAVVDVLERARRASEEIGDASRQAYWTYQLAGPLISRGERSRAREILEGALARLPDDHSLRSRLHAQLAQLESYRQDWNRARDQLDAAERHLPRDPDPAAFGAQLRGVRGDLWLQMGLLDLARRDILGARDAVRALPDPAPLRPGLDVHLANLRLASEDWETLIREVNETLKDHGEYRDRPSTRATLLVRRGIAELALERRDPERPRQARATLESVLELGEAAPQHERISAHLRLAEVCLSPTFPVELLDSARAHLSAVEHLLTDSVAEPIAPLDRAFGAALRLRWCRLSEVDSVTMDAARAELGRGMRTLQQEWIATRLRPGGIGYLETSRVRTVLAERIEAELGDSPTAEDRWRALEVVLEAQEVSTLTRRLGGPHPSRTRLRRELLEPEDALLFYVPARDGSHLFALDNDDVHHFRLEPEHLLEEARVRLMEELAFSPAELSPWERKRRLSRLPELSRALAIRLLPPSMQPKLALWRSITVVAPDLLGYVPFEALELGDGATLGLEKAVGYLPTASVGLALARRAGLPRRSDGRHTLILVAPAASVKDDDLFLPFEETDARRLRAAVGARAIEIVTGADATFEGLKSAGAGRGVWQLVVHGRSDPTSERPATLQLAASPDAAESGRVGIERFEELEDVAELVLLTACGSGRGPSRTGDPGVADFSGVLLQRGARAVVLPRTSLAYQPTLALSDVFHRQLRRGESVGESLRIARVALASEEETRDPYYWALLHAHGLPSLQVFTASTRRSVQSQPSVAPIGVWILGGIVIGWLLGRRRAIGR